MSKKFVFNKQETDDSDHEYSGSKCFEISPNVVEREIPSTGEEYLLKVIKERAKCPKVTRCSVDILTKYNKNDIEIIKPEAENVPVGLDKLKPTIEWQNIQIADFSELRVYVTRMAERRKQSLPLIFQESFKGYMKGRDILWKKVFESTEPTLSLVVGLSYNDVEAGLETILSLLHKVKPGQSIDYRTGVWLHALFTVARHPPLPDDSFILRNLCRTCIEIRAALNPDEINVNELAVRLNIVICIIAKYFGQQDLGDYELHDSKVGQIYYDTKVKQINYD